MRSLSLTGLNASQHALSSIADNVANINTPGFKETKVRFFDVLAVTSSMSAEVRAPNEGVQTPYVVQKMTQGRMEASDYPLSLALEGAGFFAMQGKIDISGVPSVSYTRDGQLVLGKPTDGSGKFTLQNLSSKYPRDLMGYNAPADALPGEANFDAVPKKDPEVISFGTTIKGQTTQSVEMRLNLDSRAAPPELAFSANDARTFNFSTSMTVFGPEMNKEFSTDTEATVPETRTLSLYFSRQSPENSPNGLTWQVNWTLSDPAGGQPLTGEHDLLFDAQGVVVDGSGVFQVGNQQIDLTGKAMAGTALAATGTTSWASSSSREWVEQDGYAKGELVDPNSDITVDAEGVIWGRFNNGTTWALGKLVLVDFVNPDGLLRLGDGQWAPNGDDTLGSGDAINYYAGDFRKSRTNADGNLNPTFIRATVRQGMVEKPNVDLSEQLVAMIIQQRNYQANAQTFKILDETLRELQKVR